MLLTEDSIQDVYFLNKYNINIDPDYNYCVHVNIFHRSKVEKKFHLERSKKIKIREKRKLKIRRSLIINASRMENYEITWDRSFRRGAPKTPFAKFQTEKERCD